MKLSPLRSDRDRGGFTLVEVALALGLVSFVLVSIVALLAVGLKNNQVTAEESRAICILSSMEADLRNTHPDYADATLNRARGKSALFQLELPYEYDPDTEVISFNRDILASTAPTIPTAGSTMVLLDENERRVSGPSPPSDEPAAYQASVIYTDIPDGSSPYRTLQARLVVSWPILPPSEITPPTGDLANLTDPNEVRGYVETLVSFPAP
ncbi:MAG: hypothetical protein AAGK14_09970 [Verrucomicrobiota bacterium]